VTFQYLPDRGKINRQVTEKEIDHQAIERENPESGSEVRENNRCGHGGSDHKNQQDIV
jgi:hypothetical protein